MRAGMKGGRREGGARLAQRIVSIVALRALSEGMMPKNPKVLRSHLKTRIAIEIVAKAFAFRRLKPKNEGLDSPFPARKGG